jgi:hypothetical protein
MGGSESIAAGGLFAPLFMLCRGGLWFGMKAFQRRVLVIVVDRARTQFPPGDFVLLFFR